MRPDALVLLLALTVALAAGSNELPQAAQKLQTAPAPFDFRQGRNWPKYLQGTKPLTPQPRTRVLLQPERKELRADAGTCFTMRILPVSPDLDPAMAIKAPDVDPRMVRKTPPACEAGDAAAPAPDRQFVIVKP
jgi:hypothetical protein